MRSRRIISLTLFFMAGFIILTSWPTGEYTMAQESPYGPLSSMEKAVLDNKGTERAFTGKYTDHFDLGLYACRKCGAPLYRSDDKFSSACGWPAFDDEIPNSVRRSPDADGRRIEITCKNCGAHLGHVFSGERLTDKNVRHCVNSISMVFEPQEEGRLRRAVFAGGCFWGVEELMRKQKGVLSAVSGYTGGKVDHPTYEQVCSKKTGHYEAVEIVYDTKLTDYETLCKYFLEIHDPTQRDGQGPDIGPQYRSVIFALDKEQKQIARKLLTVLKNKGYDVQTRILLYKRFWPAEAKHQDYYERKGTQPYCHTWQQRF